MRLAAPLLAQWVLAAGVFSQLIFLFAEAFRGVDGKYHLLGSHQALDNGSSQSHALLLKPSSLMKVRDVAIPFAEKETEETKSATFASSSPELGSDKKEPQGSAPSVHPKNRPDGGFVDAQVLSGSLSAATTQNFPLPFVDGANKEKVKPIETESAGVLTPAVYANFIQYAIGQQSPKVTPIIRVRWHKAEEYVAAAASLRDDRGKPFFFVVLAEYALVATQRPGKILAETNVSLVPATQETLFDDRGKRLPYPFILPTPLQLLQSAFGNAYALDELGVSSNSTETQTETEEGISAAEDNNNNNNDNNASEDHGNRDEDSLTEQSQFRKATSLSLRWVPFGLTRKLSAPSEERMHATELETKEPSGDEQLENEQLFINALARELPQRWLKAPDGRRIVIVLNDRIAECRHLLHLAASRAQGGTPVFLEDAEGTDPRKMLPRLMTEKVDGKKIAFVIIAIGSSTLFPLGFALFDRAVLRVPKASDLEQFIKQKETETETAWLAEKAELKDFRRHMKRRKQFLLELERDTEAAPKNQGNDSGVQTPQEPDKETKTEGMHADAALGQQESSPGSTALDADSTSSNIAASNSFSSKIEPSYLQSRQVQTLQEEPPVLVLNPFEVYVLRFNYAEVGDVEGYAEALAKELAKVPLSITIRGEMHRVAVMILGDPPETEAELGPTWARLNRLINVTIAITMLVALLCCLCMWRVMRLLKHH